MCNLKYETNRHIYETETDSEMERTDLWFPRGRWVGQGRIESLKLAEAGVPVVAQWLTNPTRNHEVAGSIPALCSDPALP